jgi:UMF1 family MFS transporter
MAYTSLLDRLGLHRRELRAWALYDVANSAWMTTVMTVVFPLFFVKVAAAGLPPEAARSRLAFASSLSVVLVGLLGPLLGAIADYRGSKKLFLGSFLALGAAATAAMYFIVEGQWGFALLTFVVGNVAVTSTLAFYNSLLPSIATADEVDRVSTAGFALGYLGGGSLLALNMAMLANPQRFGIADAGMAARLSFASVAAWWVLFSIPLFRHVPEPARKLQADETGGENAVRIAVRRLAGTLRELRVHKDAGILLLAFFVYNDAVNTIIRMAMIYGDEIGISSSHLMAAFLMIQLVGVPFAFAFGALADRIGTRRALFVTLAVYAVVSVYGFALRTTAQFFVLGFLVATVQGGIQALSRSLFATLIPRHKAGEMFGFFGVFDRFGGAFGMFVFGVFQATTGSGRPAILTLIVFFAIGAWLLTRVDVERGRRVAREAEAAAHEAAPPA